jgi:hypothetical protein
MRRRVSRVCWRPTPPGVERGSAPTPIDHLVGYPPDNYEGELVRTINGKQLTGPVGAHAVPTICPQSHITPVNHGDVLQHVKRGVRPQAAAWFAFARQKSGVRIP